MDLRNIRFEHEVRDEERTFSNHTDACMHERRNFTDNIETNVAMDFPELSPDLKFGLLTVNTIVICLNILAIFSLRNVKKLPHATKRLLLGLLVFELIFVTIATARKFIRNPSTQEILRVVGAVFLRLFLQTDMMLSIERFVLFRFPFWYMRTITESVTRVVLVSFWTCSVLIYASVRYGFCYMKIKSTDVFQCSQTQSVANTIGLIINVLISCICNWNVLRIIRSKNDVQHSTRPGLLRYYKSTGFVLTRFFLVILMTVAYGAIIVFINFFKLSITKFDTPYQYVAILICFIDPILYILWFKECQMEIYKFLAIFSVRFQHKAEAMRIEIFNIVVAENFPMSRLRDKSV
jgi:hypothetical protein